MFLKIYDTIKINGLFDDVIKLNLNTRLCMFLKIYDIIKINEISSDVIQL